MIIIFCFSVINDLKVLLHPWQIKNYFILDTYLIWWTGQNPRWNVWRTVEDKKCSFFTLESHNSYWLVEFLALRLLSSKYTLKSCLSFYFLFRPQFKREDTGAVEYLALLLDLTSSYRVIIMAEILLKSFFWVLYPFSCFRVKKNVPMRPLTVVHKK